jgi:hypothetical protein
MRDARWSGDRLAPSAAVFSCAKGAPRWPRADETKTTATVTQATVGAVPNLDIGKMCKSAGDMPGIPDPIAGCASDHLRHSFLQF